VIGDIAESLQPVAQGAAMQGQRLGGEVVVAAVLQVAVKGVDELRPFGGVVVKQGAEPAVDEGLR
jgi:hypothetical protein